MKAPKKPGARPWIPPEWEPADVSAIQHLEQGDANADQQKRALTYIVNVLAGTYDLSYRPDSERDTAFAEGRRFVGLQIVKLTKLNLERINQVQRENE